MTSSTFVSVTRARVRRPWFMPGFAFYAIRSFNQASRAPGFRGGGVLPDRKLTFWTLTTWDGEQSMRAYMTSGSHRAAMPRFANWCDEASVAHWEQDDPALPDWAEVERRMRAQGRPSKLRHPSPDHAALTFPAARSSGGAAIPRAD